MQASKEASMMDVEEFMVSDLVKKDMLNAADLKRFHLINKIWFWKQKAMMTTWEENGSKGFTVARDKEQGTGKKIYGLFRSPESFFKELCCLPPQDRCFYELIPQGQLCRAYADFEWLGDPDEKHSRIEMVTKALRAKLKELFPHGTAEIYVLCSSRETSSGSTAPISHPPTSGDTGGAALSFKHSYHIVVSNVIFQSNHDKSMQSFFESIVEDDNDLWFYTNAKAERKSILDSNVYTENRCFRLPYCNKLGSDTPLVRISADPGDNHLSPNDFDDLETADMYDVLPMTVSQPNVDGDSMLVKCSGESRVERSDCYQSRIIWRIRRKKQLIVPVQFLDAIYRFPCAIFKTLSPR